MKEKELNYEELLKLLKVTEIRKDVPTFIQLPEEMKPEQAIAIVNSLKAKFKDQLDGVMFIPGNVKITQYEDNTDFTILEIPDSDAAMMQAVQMCSEYKDIFDYCNVLPVATGVTYYRKSKREAINRLKALIDQLEELDEEMEE